jgi:hypothetical protein
MARNKVLEELLGDDLAQERGITEKAAPQTAESCPRFHPIVTKEIGRRMIGGDSLLRRSSKIKHQRMADSIVLEATRAF